MNSAAAGPARALALSPLLRALARDRFLLWASLALSMLVLLPLLQTPLLPLVHLGDRTALAVQLPRLLSGDEFTRREFALQLPGAGWLDTALLGVLSAVVSPPAAAKIVVGLAVLLMPLALMRLLLAMRRDPRLGLWAFVLSWDANVHMGFVGVSLAIAAALLYVSWILEAARGDACVSRPVAIATGLMLAVGHAQAAVTASVLLAAVALVERDKRRTLLIAAGWPLLGMLPWLAVQLSYAPADLPQGWVEWTTPAQRIEQFFGDLNNPVAHSFGRNASGLALLLLMFVPWLLTAWPDDDRGARKQALALYGAAWLLFLGLPSALGWPVAQQDLHERQATLVAVFGLLVVPSSLTARRTWLVVPGLVAAAAVAAAATLQFQQFGRRVRPLAHVIQTIEAESSVTWLALEESSPESRHESTKSLLSYAVALSKSSSPHLTHRRDLLVSYHGKRAPKRPAKPHLVDPIEWGQGHDYLITQGPGVAGYLRLSRADARLEPVIQAGMWLVYQVRRIDETDEHSSGQRLQGR